MSRLRCLYADLAQSTASVIGDHSSNLETRIQTRHSSSAEYCHSKSNGGQIGRALTLHWTAEDAVSWESGETEASQGLDATRVGKWLPPIEREQWAQTKTTQWTVRHTPCPRKRARTRGKDTGSAAIWESRLAAAAPHKESRSPLEVVLALGKPHLSPSTAPVPHVLDPST